MATELEEHYGKFCEEKRLLRKYGQVEYRTTMKYIHNCIRELEEKAFTENTKLNIMDIGAGTGRYAVPLSEEGHDVTAVELVKYNLGILKQKKSSVKAYQGDALDLKRYPSDFYDIVLLLGPMYHLYTTDDKVKALTEAKRILKPGGYIFVAYCMNEFSILSYGFLQGHIKETLEKGLVDEDFLCHSKPENLYSYVRLENIREYNELAGLKRKKIISADGAANYMRKTLSAMDEETFELFLKYHYITCERPELLGAGGHTLDIVYKD